MHDASLNQFLHCPQPHLHLQNRAGIWGLNTTRQMTTGHFTYSSITSHWFIPVYLFISWKKKPFPRIVLLKVCMLTYLVENFQGHCRKIPKRDYWGSSYPWIPSTHSSTSTDTSSCPIYIGPAILGLVTIYLVTHHHLGGYLCLSQERNSVRLPTNTPIWIIILSIQVNLRKISNAQYEFTFEICFKNNIKWINQISKMSHVLL